MHRNMTISLSEEVYKGIHRRVPKRQMSVFIETLIRPHVLNRSDDLENSYAAMFADQEREAEARKWCEGFMQDLSRRPHK